MPSAINKSSWPYLLISTCLQATFRLHSTSAKKETMEIWQVRLILVSDHTFQFQHVHRLGLQTIEMCKVRLISVPDHTFQFQHVHRLQIKRYCDVPSMLNKHFWPYLPISTCPQARVANYWDVQSTINKRSWPYLPISTCPQATNKTVLRCAQYA